MLAQTFATGAMTNRLTTVYYTQGFVGQGISLCDTSPQEEAEGMWDPFH